MYYNKNNKIYHVLKLFNPIRTGGGGRIPPRRHIFLDFSKLRSSQGLKLGDLIFILGTPFYEKKSLKNIYPVAMATKVSMGIRIIFLRKKHVNRYILTSNR